MTYWVTKIDGSLQEIAFGVAVDTAGDVYVTGRYASNPVFLYNVDGSAAASLSNFTETSNIEAVFVAKYHGTSGTLAWAARIDGLGDDFNEDVAIAVSSVSGHEGVYVTGVYASNPVYVYSADGSTTLSLSMLGNSGIFLAKFDPSTGQALWAARVDSSSTSNIDKGGGVAVDSEGDVVITGASHAGTVFVYDAEGSNNGISTFTISNYGCFIVKYNSQGAVQWVTRADSGQQDDSYAIAIDSQTNDVYITGTHYATLSFYNPSDLTSSVYTLVNPLSSNASAFVAKYSLTGTFTWATRMDGVTAGFGERGFAIAVSSGENSGVYVTGRNDSNPIVIYNADGSSMVSSLSHDGSNMVFLVKYDKDGIGQWGVRLDGAGSELGVAVAVDSTGNVYTTGTYGLNATSVVYVYDTQGSAVASLAPTSSRAGFLMKHTPSGDLLWLTSVAGGTCQGNGVAIDSVRCAVYLVGRANASLIFRNTDATNVYTLTGTSEFGFIARYYMPSGSLYEIQPLYPTYSLRNVEPSYCGPVVRIQRTSDNAHGDFYGIQNGTSLSLQNGTDLFSWLSGSNAVPVTWYDQSGNGKDVSMSNVAVNTVFNYTTAYFSNAYSTAFSVDTNMTSWTGLVYVRRKGPGSGISRIAGTDPSIERGEVGYDSSDGMLLFNGPNEPSWQSTGFQLAIDEWYLVGFHFNISTGRVKFWINGKEVYNAIQTGAAESPGPTGYTLGSRQDFNNERMDAEMGEFKLYTTELTDVEVCHYYNATKKYYVPWQYVSPFIPLVQKQSISLSYIKREFDPYAATPVSISRFYESSSNGRVRPVDFQLNDVPSNNSISFGNFYGSYRVGLLDTISQDATPIASYSMRRLRAVYQGPVLKVRRSADNEVANVYNSYYHVVSLSLQDGTPLSTWLGASTAFVDTWYDQTGTNHASQANVFQQPRLAVVNNVSCIEFIASSASPNFLDMTSAVQPGSAWFNYHFQSSQTFNTLFGLKDGDFGMRFSSFQTIGGNADDFVAPPAANTGVYYHNGLYMDQTRVAITTNTWHHDLALRFVKRGDRLPNCIGRGFTADNRDFNGFTSELIFLEGNASVVPSTDASIFYDRRLVA